MSRAYDNEEDDRLELELRGELATTLRQRAEELREACLHGRDPDDLKRDVNLSCARELETLAANVDSGCTYAVESVELLTNELTGSRQRLVETEERLSTATRLLRNRRGQMMGPDGWYARVDAFLATLDSEWGES